MNSHRAFATPIILQMPRLQTQSGWLSASEKGKKNPALRGDVKRKYDKFLEDVNLFEARVMYHIMREFGFGEGQVKKWIHIWPESPWLATTTTLSKNF